MSLLCWRWHMCDICSCWEFSVLWASLLSVNSVIYLRGSAVFMLYTLVPALFFCWRHAQSCIGCLCLDVRGLPSAESPSRRNYCCLLYSEARPAGSVWLLVTLGQAPPHRFIIPRSFGGQRRSRKVDCIVSGPETRSCIILADMFVQ